MKPTNVPSTGRASQELRVLLLEDQPADAELVIRELRQGGLEFVARTVTTEREFLAELRRAAPELILADYSLPGYDGLSALAAAKTECPEVPFIFVSGSLGEEKAIETLDRGATDYVLKDRLARLGPAVRRALREREGIRLREHAEQQRHEAEASLGESERRYRLLFDSGNDAVFVHAGPDAAGRPGRFLEVNEVACQRLGYTRAELLQMTPFDLETPESAQAIPAVVRRLEREQHATWETINVTKDGRQFPVEISSQRVKLNGQPAYLSTVRDITERKRAEATLREREEYFRALTEQATDVTTILSAQGAVLYASPSIMEVFGYQPDEVVGRSAFALIPPEDHAGVRQALAALIATPGATARLEVRFRHQDGSWRELEATTRNLLDDPNVKGIVVNSRDNTERKQLERALRESSQFNQQIVASAQEGIVVYGRDLKYQVWNPFMEQLTGLPASEVLGKHPDQLFPFLRKAGVLASIEKALAGEPVSSIDVHVEGLPSGKSDWTSQTNGPLRNAAGEIIGVIGIVRDMTERKRAELRIAGFANLGCRLSTAKTAREAGEIMVEVADQLLGWDACMFDLYSAAENKMSHLLCMDLINGRRTECPPPGRSGPPTEYPKRAIEQGAQLLLRDRPQAVRRDGLPFGDTSRPSASLMWVPVRRGTEVVGVLSIQSYTPNAYDARSLETLQALADHGGGALERLRAQEALSESEASFRSVWEHSIDGMRLTDAAGRIIAVNEAFCRSVKLPRAKLEGELFSVMYKGNGPADGIEVYHQRFANGTIIPRLAARVQLWNGEEVDLEVSSSYVELGRRGKMLLSIFRDVSERRRAELRVEAFSNLGQRLSAATSPAEAARTIYACAGLFWKWDCGVLDLESAQPGHVETVMAYDLVDGQRCEVTSPNRVSRASAMSRRVMAQGAELILRHPGEPPPNDTTRFGDVSRLSASIMCVPVHAESRTVGVLSIQSYAPDAYTREDLQMLQALADHCGGAMDRLRMEQAWRTTQERLGYLLGQSPAVIYSLKTDGQTFEPAWVSDNVERLLGYTVAECQGPEGLFAQLHPQDRQTVIDGLVQLLASKEIARDYRVRHKNGEYRWVRDEQRLVCDAAGVPVEIVGSWMDITGRKALEEQLRQSQKMEAVGQLAGGVAHDFNNMLAVIRGNAELLLMDEAQHSAETREGLKHVIEASERAANLTRQLLAFSRKQVLQPQPLVLNEIIANLTKMLKRVIGENIDLQCHYTAPLPHVQADPGMMEQVILNLVVNARDAMPEGGQLRIATEAARLDEAHARVNPEARAGDFVCLIVSDTGTGIAPEVMSRMFEPFFTTKAIDKGTGLGLATVYGIVQQHQGWIEVSSQVGAGSTFKVFLPIIPTPIRQAGASPGGASVDGGEETILLVEDDQAVRLMTRRVLESKGYRIWEAACPREALEVWQAHAGEIALLLTDIIMPEKMSGRDLAEQLWQQSPQLKVIFMSGYSADVVGRNTDFIRRTKSHFLQKPCSSRALLETVRQSLDERAAAVASAAAGQAG